MIITKYLVRETLKNQIMIIFILLLTFFCQNLVKILEKTVHNDLPIKLELSLLGLGVPEIAQIILPLSLSLSLIMTFSKLYTENEITAMHACGLSNAVLIKVAMLLACLTGSFSAINVIWAGPLSSRYQDKILAEIKANPALASLAQRKFQQATDGNSVLFIEKVDGNHFNNVFLAHFRPKGHSRPSVIVADSGHVGHRKDGSQVITLDKGTRFEGTALLRNFRITDFQNYQAIISHQTVSLGSSHTEQMNMYTLIKRNNNRTRAELHWRITLIFSVFIMALMVVPLSLANLYQGPVPPVLLSVTLYLTFFFLQTTIKSNGGKGKLDPMLWTWVINSFYFFLAVALNLWDTLPLRRLRSLLMKQELSNAGV